jgi:hypothetical protein
MSGPTLRSTQPAVPVQRRRAIVRVAGDNANPLAIDMFLENRQRSSLINHELCVSQNAREQHAMWMGTLVAAQMARINQRP